jgi:hypothetical protein
MLGTRPDKADEQQSLVDALSLTVDRTVLLDDPALIPIGFSRRGKIDTARTDCVLGRGSDGRVRDALLAHGQDSGVFRAL